MDAVPFSSHVYLYFMCGSSSSFSSKKNNKGRPSAFKAAKASIQFCLHVFIYFVSQQSERTGVAYVSFSVSGNLTVLLSTYERRNCL
jgi:hypothetical protein